MTTALRPMSTGELLDRCFNLYRNNFPLFAGISALAALVLIAGMVLRVFLNSTSLVPAAMLDSGAAPYVTAIYFLLIVFFYVAGASLATGATIYAVSKVHLGERVTIRESYSSVFPVLGRITRIVLSIILRMLGVFLLIYFTGVIVVVVLARSGGLRAVGRTGAIAITTTLVLGMLLLGFAIMLRTYFKYSLAVQACLLEKTRAMQSMKRSKFLTKGAIWRIFLIHLLMGIMGAVVVNVLLLPGLVIKSMGATVALVWQSLAVFIALALAFPISTIAIALVYYDQRVRKEAFDLQLMMEAVGQEPQSQAAAAPIG